MRDFLAITGFFLPQFVLLALIRVWRGYRTSTDRLRMHHAIGERHDPVEAGQRDWGPSPRLERFLRGTGPFIASDRLANAPPRVVSQALPICYGLKHGCLRALGLGCNQREIRQLWLWGTF